MEFLSGISIQEIELSTYDTLYYKKWSLDLGKGVTDYRIVVAQHRADSQGIDTLSILLRHTPTRENGEVLFNGEFLRILTQNQQEGVITVNELQWLAIILDRVLSSTDGQNVRDAADKLTDYQNLLRKRLREASGRPSNPQEIKQLVGRI